MHLLCWFARAWLFEAADVPPSAMRVPAGTVFASQYLFPSLLGSMIACLRFSNGRCKAGAKCRFSHVRVKEEMDEAVPAPRVVLKPRPRSRSRGRDVVATEANAVPLGGWAPKRAGA